MKLGVGLATTEGRMSSPCVGRRRLGEIGRPPGCRTRADARAGAGNGELMRAREGNKRERVARGGKQARESAREAEYILPRGGKGKRPRNLGVPAVERERRREGKRRGWRSTWNPTAASTSSIPSRALLASGRNFRCMRDFCYIRDGATPVPSASLTSASFVTPSLLHVLDFSTASCAYVLFSPTPLLPMLPPLLPLLCFLCSCWIVKTWIDALLPVLSAISCI